MSEILVLGKAFSESQETMEEGKQSSLKSGYSLCWENLCFSVKDKLTGQEKLIVKNVSGFLSPGSVCAILGSSGAGKSSFLDAIAGRKSPSQIQGKILINGTENVPMKHVSKYCTQDDALFGSLTVFETLMYAARFNLPQLMTESETVKIVNDMIVEFGLSDVANTIIGTPLLKGCSGGQVRRVSCASQIIGMEGGILFLDEPTSGLDSVAAFSVIETVKKIAAHKNATIMATIHQPSTETFELFTHVLILAKGETVFFGPRADALAFFDSVGKSVPLHANPSDYFLRITNVDFLTGKDQIDGQRLIDELVQGYKTSPFATTVHEEIEKCQVVKSELCLQYGYTNSFWYQTKTLMSRAFLNAAKNPLAYWVRVAMYVGLAILMGTTWLRLGFDQAQVINRMVSLYFSVAFLAFMSVAGIPAFLEERLVFIRESGNGLYGVESYLLSNFLVSMPFLLIISVSFSVTGYFLMGYQAAADKFFIYVGYMFMMLMVAEAQVVFISVVIPIFVAALTIAAFLNGMWMVVEGFALIKISDIPAGWRYTLHYVDFQKYTFESLLSNELLGLTFTCAGASNSTRTASESCSCLVPSSTPSTCTFTGYDVLSYYEHTNVSYWLWFVALVAILFAFKFATFLVLKNQRNK